MADTQEKPKTIKIKYVRSGIGALKSHRLIVRSLGLRKLNQIVERNDTPAVRNMVKKIPYLVQIIEDEQ